MGLGEKIRHYRIGLGWTLDQLSDLSGVEKGTISALEVRKSKRSEYAGAIASAFGLTVDQLLEERDYLPDLLAGARFTEVAKEEDHLSPKQRALIKRIPDLQDGVIDALQGVIDATTHPPPPPRPATAVFAGQKSMPPPKKSREGRRKT